MIGLFGADPRGSIANLFNQDRQSLSTKVGRASQSGVKFDSEADLTMYPRSDAGRVDYAPSIRAHQKWPAQSAAEMEC